MNVIKEVIDKWRNAGVALNPPATAASLLNLAELLDEPVPDDLQHFYCLANGMLDYATEGWHLSFWSIERILKEKDFANDSLAVADILISSHFVRVRPRGAATGVTVDGSADAFASLEAFFDRYLREPGHFGPQEVR